MYVAATFVSPLTEQTDFVLRGNAYTPLTDPEGKSIWIPYNCTFQEFLDGTDNIEGAYNWADRLFLSDFATILILVRKKGEARTYAMRFTRIDGLMRYCLI